MKKVKFNKISILLLCIALVGCSGFLLPVRNTLIDIAEAILGRGLNRVLWQSKLLTLSLVFIMGNVVLSLIFQFLKFPVFQKSDARLFNLSESVKLLSDRKFLMMICILFLLQVGIRLFWISQKKSFHIDEVYSIQLANRNEYGCCGISKRYEVNKKYNGKELKESFLWDNDSIFDSIKDIIALHRNVNDSPHTNFYYSCLRLWFTGIKTSDNKFIFWYGCALNLILFSISFFAMYILFRKLTDNKLSILLCLGLAFFNPATISQTAFLRPYELQCTMFVLFSVVFISGIQAIKNNTAIESKRNFFITIVILALTALSGYFSLFYIGLAGLGILIFAYKNKKYNTARYYIYAFLLSLVLTQILYLMYFLSLMVGGRATEALSKLNSTNFLDNIKNFFISFLSVFHCNNIFLIIAYSLIIILFIIIIFHKNKKYNLEKLILFSVVLLWCTIVLYFAPYKIQRYVTPAIPLFSILFITEAFENKSKAIISTTTLCLFLLSCMPLKINSSTIEHIDDSGIENIQSIKHEAIPIVINCHNKDFWLVASLIPYVKDAQTCYFVKNVDDIKELDLPNTFWLCIFIFDNKYYTERIPPNLLYTQKNEHGYYSEYLISNIYNNEK